MIIPGVESKNENLFVITLFTLALRVCSAKDGKETVMKIFGAEKADRTELLEKSGMDANAPAGTIISDGKEILALLTADGAVRLTEIQLAGKKRMDVKDFLIGFREPESYTVTKGTSSEVLDKYRESIKSRA